MSKNLNKQFGVFNETIQYLRHLGSRLACSEKERSFAHWIKNQLNSFGYDVVEDEYSSMETYTWHYVVIWGGLVFSVILMRLFPLVAVILSVALTFIEYFEMNSFPVLSVLFRWKKSINIIGKKEDKPQVILVSHIDSAISSIFFDPRFMSSPRRSVLLTIFSSLAICGFTIIYLLFSWNSIYILSWIPALYLLFLSVGHVHREFFMETTPGGNDNGSGVAVSIEVARRLKDANIPFWIVFTGSEESGTNGAIAFEKKYRELIVTIVVLVS